MFAGIENRLPGVSLDVPLAESINGSLWTLPYEIRMYAILALVLGLVAYAGRRLKFLTLKHTLLVLSVLSVILHLTHDLHGISSTKSLRLFSMFFTGAALYA